MTNTKSPITTHILDVSLGRPAAGVSVQLSRLDGATWSKLADGKTDADGRVAHLLAPGSLTTGTYQLTFMIADYFAASQRASFYPHVDIVFEVKNASEHYHVPLLLSPFGYSTYRGS